MFNLKTELENYKPFDNAEAESVVETLNFLDRSDNCFDRSNLKGHVTAGAFVCDREGNILLNHHKESGMWFQFGGHSDGEADSLNVAKREVMEEAGITEFNMGVPSIFDVAVNEVEYSPRKNEPAHKHYDINFMFVVEDKSFEISSESFEIKWVTLDEAGRLVHPLDISMQRMIKKYALMIKSGQL